MGEKLPETPYISALGSIERARDEQGSEGCFMEVLNILSARAGLIEQLFAMRQIDQTVYETTLDAIGGIASGLPPIQSPEAITQALGQLNSIPFFGQTMQNNT